MGVQDRTRELQQEIAPPDGVRYLRPRVPAEDEVIPVLLQAVRAARQPRLAVEHLRFMRSPSARSRAVLDALSPLAPG